jgi:hypothetical protein
MGNDDQALFLGEFLQRYGGINDNYYGNKEILLWLKTLNLVKRDEWIEGVMTIVLDTYESNIVIIDTKT